MFNKILVAVDRSASGKQVLDAAIAIAKSLDANLMLLHVQSNEEEDYPQMPPLPTMEFHPFDSLVFETYQQQVQTYEQEGLELLRAYVDQATVAGVKAEFSQNQGNAGRTICAMAKNWGANLIIMGRRGHSGLNEIILGSVSNYVLHHATCSVFTVQGKVQETLETSQIPQSALAS